MSKENIILILEQFDDQKDAQLLQHIYFFLLGMMKRQEN